MHKTCNRSFRKRRESFTLWKIYACNISACKGQLVEQIAPLFKNAPDYNEKVTLYQLNHLSGNTSTTQYACPSCEKLKSQDLCFAIPECDNIINPIQFGRKRYR